MLCWAPPDMIKGLGEGLGIAYCETQPPVAQYSGRRAGIDTAALFSSQFIAVNEY